MILGEYVKLLKSLLMPTNFKRILFFLVGDILFSVIGLYLAYLLRFNFSIPDNFFISSKKIFIVILRVG